MNFFIEFIIFIIITIICTLIFSMIILNVFFGIPKTYKLKKMNILMQTTKIYPYIINTLIWSIICFFSFYFILNNVNNDGKEIITFGILFSLLISFSSLRKSNYYNNMNELIKMQKKHINPIINDIYDNSLKITENLKEIISNYNYEKHIYKNQSLFVSVSCLFCFYYYEIFLKENCNYSDKQSYYVLFILISELISHLDDTSFESAFGAYLEIRNTLNKFKKNDNDNLAEQISTTFLSFAIQDFYIDEIETYLLYDIFDQFNNILKSTS